MSNSMNKSKIGIKNVPVLIKIIWISKRQILTSGVKFLSTMWFSIIFSQFSIKDRFRSRKKRTLLISRGTHKNNKQTVKAAM